MLYQNGSRCKSYHELDNEPRARPGGDSFFSTWRGRAGVKKDVSGARARLG